MEMREHEFEPVRGLPGHLPDGERVLWQGAPDWRAFALRVFHLRLIAIYTAIMTMWTVATTVYDGGSVWDAVAASSSLIGAMGLAAAILSGVAWLIQQTTVYTLTNRRLVLRIGIALPITINVPFKIIGAANVKLHADGTGDLPVAITGADRVAIIHLWPHARPWHLRAPQPMMRCIPDAASVAEMLATAMNTARVESGLVRTVQSAPSRESRGSTPSPAKISAGATA